MSSRAGAFDTLGASRQELLAGEEMVIKPMIVARSIVVACFEDRLNSLTVVRALHLPHRASQSFRRVGR